MFHDFKLGRIERDLPANLPNLRRDAIAAMSAPPRLIRDHIGFEPTMGDNNNIGSCVPTGLANAAIGQAALGRFAIQAPVSKVVGFYEDAGGYVPGQPATDTGMVIVDALTYQGRNGYDLGGPTPLVGLWANLEAGNTNLIRAAMARLGLTVLGVNLALADQQGDIWDTDTPASYGDPTPGSWGPHCLCGWAYTGTADTDLVTLITWARQQRATWRWLRSRLSEAHVIWHRQLDYAGRNFTGVDEYALAGQLQAFQAAA